MIAAKPCFPWAHTGVLATHRVCHGPAQVPGKPPETMSMVWTLTSAESQAGRFLPTQAVTGDT